MEAYFENVTHHELQCSKNIKISNCVDSESPAGGLLLVHICVVFAAPLRWFGHGSPSSGVMLRNVAAVSRLAEQTSHQPCFPPPHLFVQQSITADFCAVRLTLAEGYWVTSYHRQGKKNGFV